MKGTGEKPVKVTVVLLNRQVVFLDRLSAMVREKLGVSLQRTEIIRALVDALEESGVDLAKADLGNPETKEGNLKALLVGRLRRR